MKKADLIAKVAEDAGITKAQADAAVKSFTDSIGDTLKAGDKLSLLGFGTFSVQHRAAREGRNPATGEKMQIKSKNVVKFKAGKAMNELVNQ